MELNKLYTRDKEIIFITEGQYEVNNRVSNYWSGFRVKKNGEMGAETGGYGYEFKPYEGEYEVRIIFPTDYTRRTK